MATALRISRLSTRIQLPSPEDDNSWSDQLQRLAQRSLPDALAGVAERALARAGLPPDAVVAVRRLELRLRLADGATPEAILRGWSQGLETALCQELLRSGGVGRGTAFSHASADVACFGDAWEAELTQLGRLAEGLAPAWWADRLMDGRGVALDLAPTAILQRWLESQPARAVAAMARLAGETQGVENLLDPSTATAIAALMARRLSQRAEAPPAWPEIGSPLRTLLEQCLGQLRRHSFLGADSHEAAATAAARRPWRLALLLHSQPALGLLPAQTLLAVANQPAAERFQRSDTKHPSVLSDQDPARFQSLAPHSAETNACAWVHAGGLLLLLNRPELWMGADLALLALQRLLAPLAIGERAAALQGQRPLLTLLAPDRPWPERLDQGVVLDPAAAEHQLAALIAAIPEAIGFAPGALRQVYGPRHGATPPLPDRETHKLAALLWRPGLLEWDDWQISLSWPLASVDGALRRGGWDLDPGWQPALRRVVRFHYRAEVLPPLEGQP
jgi:hypothetical protein